MTVCAPARFVLTAETIAVKIPFEIARHKKVQLAVVVVIEETGAGAPAGGSDTSARGDIGKRSVAVVVVERVAAVAGDVYVLKAVVIEIADGDTHSVAILRHAGEAGFFGDVGEGAIRVLMVEPVPVFAAGLVRHPAGRHGVF